VCGSCLCPQTPPGPTAQCHQCAPVVCGGLGGRGNRTAGEYGVSWRHFQAWKIHTLPPSPAIPATAAALTALLLLRSDCPCCCMHRLLLRSHCPCCCARPACCCIHCPAATALPLPLLLLVPHCPCYCCCAACCSCTRRPLLRLLPLLLRPLPLLTHTQPMLLRLPLGSLSLLLLRPLCLWCCMCQAGDPPASYLCCMLELCPVPCCCCCCCCPRHPWLNFMCP
jgi:hypothetical protein